MNHSDGKVLAALVESMLAILQQHGGGYVLMPPMAMTIARIACIAYGLPVQAFRDLAEVAAKWEPERLTRGPMS